MENSYYKGLEPFWGEWYIDKLIGEGSFGKVFRIVRNTSSGQEEAALKAITIPQSNSEYSEMISYESDENTVNAYYKDAVMNLNKETLLMAALRGNKNIVEYQDHVINEHKNEVGWDILIRMELLTSLTTLLRERDLKRDEVVRLGIDICNALIACQKYGIIHRDIKPANIFIDKTGNYKLGDFGVSRAMEKTQGFMSKKGTYSFMAPEVYKGESYGVQADIYSLGMVMYFLMNARKIPFQPLESKGISFSVKEECLNRRMSGESIPAPAFANKALAKIILKACEYNSKNRYRSAKEMADDLKKLISVNQKQEEHTWEQPYIENQPVEAGDEKHFNVVKGIYEEIIDDGSDSDETVAMFDDMNSSRMSELKSQYTDQVKKNRATKTVNKIEDIVLGSETTFRVGGDKKVIYGLLLIVILIVLYFTFTNKADRGSKAINTTVSVETKTTISDDATTNHNSTGNFEDTSDPSEDNDLTADEMYNMGQKYYFGDGVEKDCVKALEWYEKAADAGSIDAMAQIGFIYSIEEDEQDYTKAKEWYEKAAEYGDTYSMLNLGDIYYNGDGVEQDYAKAKEWYEKAAEGGNKLAAYELGDMYYGGNGVEQDYIKAREWYEKSAEGGYKKAMNKLSEMYLAGEGVEKDAAKAEEWLQKANEAGI